MKIKLYLVGKTDNSGIDKPLETFLKRVNRYIKFEVVVLPELKKTSSLSQSQQKTKEGEMLLDKITPGEHLILLDENGKMFTSVKFSQFIEKHGIQSTQCLSFVIGGPYGFSEAVYQRANMKISLSPMTFSHQLIRVIFAEQLYRAFTIINNEPYHHE